MTQRLARTDSTANERRQMKQQRRRGSRSNTTLTGECGFRRKAEEQAQPSLCSRGQHCALLMKANQKLGSYRETERDSVPPTTLLPVNGLLKKRVLAELPVRFVSGSFGCRSGACNFSQLQFIADAQPQ